MAQTRRDGNPEETRIVGDPWPSRGRIRSHNRAQMERSPAEPGLAASTSGRIGPVLERLLAERRYEEALRLLRAAQCERPPSTVIANGIALLEERLAELYIRPLGDLRRVPRLAAGADKLATLTPSELGLALKVDDSTPLARLLERSGPSRFDAARRLAALVERGVLSLPGSEPNIIIDELAVRRPPARTPRPIDCERTAQIALVPDAQALLSRARRSRRRRRGGRGWWVIGACICLVGATAVAATVWHDSVWSLVRAAMNAVGGATG
jgi:hypothetical protein